MQATDIVLDGVGYMVAPGSYKRASAGEPEGRAGRWVQREFIGGQRRALQLERDAGWDGLSVGPALRGQGVEPWPFSTTSAETNLAVTATATRKAKSVIVGSYPYVGLDRYLYRGVALTASSWSPMTQAADMGAGNSIAGLGYYQGKVAIACGASKDIQLWDGTTLTAFAAGEKATALVGYANRLIWADATAGNEAQLKLSTGGAVDVRQLDGPIVNLALHGGKVVIATRSSLYLLGGKSDPAAGKWLGDPEPFFTGGLYANDDDYSVLLSYGGKLYTYVAGKIMEWNPNGGSNRTGWRETGVEGKRCFGGCVAADRLIVCVQSAQGNTEVWAYDGTGWWLIMTAAGATKLWPCAVGGAGNIDLVVFRSGSTTLDLVRLVFRDAATTNYATSGTYLTSLIDAGERDKLKAWRRMGASFAAPEDRGNPASVDQVTVSLAYSVDGGSTFATLGNLISTDPTDRTVELAFDPAGGSPESATLQLRVTWSSVLDWAPTLTCLWADYELLNVAARRRRWTMTVSARDGLAARDGAAMSATGRQHSANLWSSWAAGATLTLRDLDYDATLRQYAVRVAGIEEAIPKPADAGRWGDSLLTLTLVEV